MKVPIRKILVSIGSGIAVIVIGVTSLHFSSNYYKDNINTIFPDERVITDTESQNINDVLSDDQLREIIGMVLDGSGLYTDEERDYLIDQIALNLNSQLGSIEISNLDATKLMLLEQCVRDSVYNSVQIKGTTISNLQKENMTTTISAMIENGIAVPMGDMNYNTDILEQRVNNHYTNLTTQLTTQELQIIESYNAIENLTQHHQDLTNTFYNTTNEMSAKEQNDVNELHSELDQAVEHYCSLVAPDWSGAENYGIGNVVMHNGVIYRALVPNKDIVPYGHGETWKATRLGLEIESITAMTAGTNWSSSGVYKAGEVVVYDNILYKSLKNGNTEPLSDTTAWKVTSVSAELYNESFKPEVESLIKQLEIQKSSTSLTQVEQDRLQADIDRLNDVMLNGTLEEIYQAISDSKVDIIQITQNFTETGATSTLNELINKLNTLHDSATTTTEQKADIEAIIEQLINARDNATSSDVVNAAITAAQQYLVNVETAKMEGDLENSINELITKLTALKNSTSTTAAQKTEIETIITQLTDARDNGTAYDQIQQLLRDAQTYITNAETGNASNDIQVEFQRMIEKLQILHDSTSTNATQKAEIEALIARLNNTKDFETDYNAIRQALTDANSYINALTGANADASTANTIALLQQQIETLMNSDITTSEQKARLQEILDNLANASTTTDLDTIQQIIREAQETLISTINQTNITSREIFAGDIYRPGVTYHVGDYVVGSDGKMYRCLREPCTLDPTTDAYDADGVGTYWQITNVTKELSNSSESAAEKWEEGTTYNIGEYASRNGTLYKSLINNNTHDPLDDHYDANGVGTYWKITNLSTEIKASNSNTSDKWVSGRAYKRGAFCIYNDQLYRCVTAHTSGASFDTSKWAATTIGKEIPTYQYDASNKTLYIYTQDNQTVY